MGRPSTYASVIATILDRGYVWKKGTALVPSFTAFAVVGLLERYFGNLVDYGFTASMEDDLDEIASGTEEALPWLTRFYFGSDAPGAMASDGTEVDTLGLKATVASHLAEIDAREVNSIPLGEGSDGQPIVARVGRYGPYLQRGEDRASIPDDLAPDELTIARAEEILAAPSNDRVLGTHPESGLDIQVKAGRFGPYVQVGELTEGGEKPRTASLFAAMDPATLTFEQALDLLRIPRTVGTDPETGEDVVAHNGRFGPYLKRGTGHAQPDERGAAPHGHTRRGAGPVRAAQAASGPRGRGATARARDRSGHQPARRREGRALRPLRHRRHHERQPAQGRRGRDDRAWTGRRSSWPTGAPPALDAQEEGGAKKTAPEAKKTAKKTAKKAAKAARRRQRSRDGREEGRCGRAGTASGGSGDEGSAGRTLLRWRPGVV